MDLELPVKTLLRNTVISLLFGVLGLVVNLHCLSLSYRGLELHIALGQLLPLLVAFAWGSFYSLPGAILASSFVFFCDSYALGEQLYYFLYYFSWIPLIGKAEERRQWSDGNQLPHYYALFLYCLVSGVLYVTFHKSFSSQTLSRGDLLLMNYCDNMTLLSCLNLAMLLMLLPPVRSFFRLSLPTQLKKRAGYRFILGAIGGIFLFWGLTIIAEALVTGSGGQGAVLLRERGSDLLIKNLLYFNLVIILTIVMYNNWELQSDTGRKIIDRGDILFQILNNISEGVLVMDREWKIRFANSAALSMGPYDRKSFGQPIGRVVTLHSVQNGAKLTLGEIREFLQSERSMTCLLSEESGGFRRVVISLSVLPRTKHGYRYLSLIRDITEEYEKEQKTFHNQKQEAVGRLVSGVAHDFNNRLAGIMGFAQLIEKEASLDDIYYYADQITESAGAAAELTAQLLTFSRKKPLQRRELELHSLVRGVLPVLKHTISKEIVIHVEESQGDLKVRGDKSLLENALLNLAINGAYAMDKKGLLSFKIGIRRIDEVYCIKSSAPLKPGSYGFLTIGDTGSGIKGENLEKIFDPYFTTKKEGDGTGLGLSTVKEIVEKHGGEITVESEWGRGTAFTILLPLVQEEERA
ncbi:MAG: ATP-binding protein [Spirochaetales bacterium]|nr:ATP-binding protein [Spirochaetales bacterium]